MFVMLVFVAVPAAAAAAGFVLVAADDSFGNRTEIDDFSGSDVSD